VIPEEVRKKLSSKAGNNVEIEVKEGKSAIIQSSVAAPDEIFVKPKRGTVERAPLQSKRTNESKAKRLLKALGKE
jgi:bifunctional DNA-binding transcriptional regulator/antitoxin component of YhaV-PrlF toxin-antitoxin module